MNWILLGSAVIMTGSVLAIFSAERSMRVYQIELRRLRELEEAKKPPLVGGRRRH